MKFCLKSERIEHKQSKTLRVADLLTQVFHYFLNRNIIKREFIFLTSLYRYKTTSTFWHVSHMNVEILRLKNLKLIKNKDFSKDILKGFRIFFIRGCVIQVVTEQTQCKRSLSSSWETFLCENNYNYSS